MEALNVIEAANYVGLSRSFLNKRRVYSGGPLYLKVGKRVIYDKLDLDAWLQDKKIANTSQTAAAAA
jgi:Helix-turn-helix domain